MLKANSKKAHENITRYILEWMFDEIEERNDWNKRENIPERYDPNSPVDVCGFILDDFVRVRGHEIKRTARPVADIFHDYGGGLPLGGLFCYRYNREAKNDLGELLEENQAERDRFTEEQAEKMLSHLIFRECERHTKRIIY